MNFYEVLGVDRDASDAEIRRAFRERARRFHPDVNDHPRAQEQFTVLTTARDVLTDPDERRAYDRLDHGEYVAERLNGALPQPEMTPRHEGGRARDGRRAAAGGRSAGAGAGADTDGRAGTGGAEAGRDADERGGGGRIGDGRDGGVAPSAGSRGSPEAGSRASAGGATPSAASSDAPGTAPPPDGRAGTDGGRAAGHTPEAARRRKRTREEARGHLSASFRWPAVVAAAAVYGYGLAQYMRANRPGLGRLAAYAGEAAPRRLLVALHRRRFGVADPLAYVDASGLHRGLHPTDAGVLLAGAVLLPLAVTAAVVGLRRHTTWRPSLLYVLAAFGPAAGIGLSATAAVGAPAVPLWAHLLLLAGLPALAVLSFLLNRFVLVMPLRRREDLIGVA